MKLVNPLYYPLAVSLGGIALVAGVRFVNLSSVVMLPIAVGIATVGAIARHRTEPQTLNLDNPELERELQSVQKQAKNLAEKADTLRLEATQLLSSTLEVELLAAVQYACDRATELPAKIDQLTRRLQGADSLLSVSDLQQQLAQVQAKLPNRAGVAKEQLSRLEMSLLRNIQLARQGQDARQAQVVSLSTIILDAGGVLQQLQNKLRTADLNNSDQVMELRRWCEELRSFEENVDLLVSK
ncbi:MAG TPA: hypothetical protein V6D30_13680 [Leptolyngbyaceae cyanobacterium]|jgi:hypothetical protein